MGNITVKTPDGKLRTVTLMKRITSIGRSSDNDIPLEDPLVPEGGLHILFDGKSYQIAGGVEFSVNGKKKAEAVLSANDVIVVGGTHIVFQIANPESQASKRASDVNDTVTENPDEARPENMTPEVAALRRLTQFSERLLGTYQLEPLLESLMDEVIDITRADKGFLILMESNQLKVKVARNLTRENIEDAVERVSDSIVAKVVRTQKALIISDALDDPEFNSSESVVNLKLLSVMCVPLAHKGQLFGLLYLGNDRLVNRFEPRTLDTLMVFAAQASLLLQNALLVNDLRLDNLELKKKLEDQQYGDIIGAASSVRDIFKRIDKVSPTDISVLITGETGTGKELIAKEIHRRSPRSKGPFVVVNCGAIPENLLESELFGHVKGAFTGAIATKPGKFQAAIGGTLFLDEIGEMPLQLQVKILRALQEKIVYKVGDNRGESVDIRVVCATHRNLEEAAKSGKFREDLYFRINVVTLKLPPLRERGDDIVVLAKFFLVKYAHEFNSKAKGFTPACTVAMKKYGWPGNIRELENRLKKAVVLADRPLLSPEDLDLMPENLDPIMPLAQAKEEFQKRYISEVLERNNGNRTKTAKDLGVDPRTIFRHLEKVEADKSGQVLSDDVSDSESSPPDVNDRQ